MSLLGRISVCLLIASVVSCSKSSSAPSEPVTIVSQGWKLTARTPELSSSGLEVQGSMLLENVDGATTRGGGVCIVADLNNSTPCTSSADCAALPLPEGGFHYCAAINGGGAKICWTRPGAATAYCNRGTQSPGVISTPLVPARVNGAATTWASYTCLANAETPAGCGSGDPAQYVFLLGPVLKVD